MPQSRCVICNARFLGYGARGVCQSCQARYPVFIPRAQLSRDSVTPGYVIRSDGLLRYDRSASAQMQGDAPRMMDTQPIDKLFPTEPLKKKTAQQKLNSVHEDMADTLLKLGGIPESIKRDAAHIFGKIVRKREPNITQDQVRALAGFYLEGAHNEKEAGQRKLVTRTA